MQRMFISSLQDNFIQNWLVAGPQQPLAQLSVPERLLAERPVDRGAFFETSTRWRYWLCMEDHLVDLSTHLQEPGALEGWAYTTLHLPTPQQVTLVLSSCAACEVWLNGEPVAQSAALTGENPVIMHTVRVPVTLQKENGLYLRMAGQGQNVRLTAALQIEADPQVLVSISVKIPTRARYPQRQEKLEQAFAWAYLEEVTNHRGKSFNLRFAPGAALPEGENLHYVFQIQDAKGMIYVDGSGDLDTNGALDVGHTVRLNERPYYVVLRAVGKEYYEQDMRYQVELPIMVLDNAYSTRPYGTFETRRAELLNDAAKRDGSVYYQAARMTVEKWQDVSAQEILAACAGDDLERLGAVGLLLRFGGSSSFPAGLAEELTAKITAQTWDLPDELPQSSVVLRRVAALLAAQIRQDTGQLAVQAQALQELLRTIGQVGFEEWNSDPALERLVAALTHLVSFANIDALRDLAAVVLDKLLFWLAVHTFQGVLGGGQACALPAAARSGQLTATAGIMRLLSGMGVFTARAAGAVSLALAEYEFPAFFGDLALAHMPESSRERHAAADGEVNIVTYRTPAYLLSSAQAHRPGAVDLCGLAWSAVLGPDALVYTSAPASMRLDDAAQPGFWIGNASLPRVAQWKDALLAVYQLPTGVWTDFTHAYFPTLAFDEWKLQDNWAFARKGEAYLALTAAQPVELVQRRPDALRELRSYGRQNTWICQMGSAAEDGSFAGFCARVAALPMTVDNEGVTFTTLRRETLSFGWQAPFTVDGQAVTLEGFPHLDHPNGQAQFPAQALDVNFRDYLLRLDFA